MQRSAMRELAFKLVYEIEVQKESEEEQLQIFLENCDSGFDILFYKNDIIFMNDYSKTLSIVKEDGNRVWKRWLNFFALNESQNEM